MCAPFFTLWGSLIYFGKLVLCDIITDTEKMYQNVSKVGIGILCISLINAEVTNLKNAKLTLYTKFPKSLEAAKKFKATNKMFYFEIQPVIK